MKKKLLFSISLIFILISISYAGSRQPSWRCGNHLILLGTSSAEVLLKCGEPTSIMEKSLQTTGSAKSRLRGQEVETDYEETSQIVEDWVYNCGPYGFIMTLRFRGNNLVEIILGDRGFGESDCEGAEYR